VSVPSNKAPQLTANSVDESWHGSILAASASAAARSVSAVGGS
jgi:hypothetical protein